MRVRTPLVVATALVLNPVTARADGGGNVELSSFRPALDSRGFITVDGADALEAGQLSFGLVSTWAKGLLRLDGAGATYRVQHVLTPTLVGAIGLPRGLEIAVALPFGVVAGDRDPDAGGATLDPNDDDDHPIAAQGIGDLGIHGKAELGHRGGVALAAAVSAYLPTAAERSWLGSGGTSLAARGIVDVRRGRFRAALNGGMRWRLGGDQRFVDDDPMVSAVMPTTGEEIVVGPAFTGGAALSWELAPGKIDAIGEVFATLPLSGHGYRPMEALAGLKVYLADRSHLSLGAGAGLLGDGGNPDARAWMGIVFEPKSPARRRLELDPPTAPIPAVAIDGDRDDDGFRDRDDACPDDPEDFDEFEDGDGCPEADNDHDKLVDLHDLCANDPEDFDEVQDDDGCPETDADHDRIADVDDSCKLKPEVWNGNRDDDGCPDRSRADVVGGIIRVMENIYFEFDSAQIQERSHEILGIIAETIKLNPDLKLIAIGGHTDDRGSDAYNLDLSQRRADSVRAFLIEKGVAADRLSAEGYGETMPLDHRHNAAAWAKNRRVEFVIIERDSVN